MAGKATLVGALQRRITGASPFEGNHLPKRVKLRGRDRPSLPIPHPWNYRDPLRILDAYFDGADEDEGAARHNRYFDTPGLPLGFVTREPDVIRAILLATGNKPSQFHRDRAPSKGIARATGDDTLLYANGDKWRHQKRLAAAPFARSSLFDDETFQRFEATFRATVKKRLEKLRSIQAETGQEKVRVALEPEIAVVMLEMLVNDFFGGEASHEALRRRFAPAIRGLTEYMVKDTVGYQVLAPFRRMSRRGRQILAWQRDFEDLVDIALSGRAKGHAAWRHFGGEIPDAKLRSNLRVFLAGAVEATTSLASWAVSHLSRDPALQEAVFAEVAPAQRFDPDALAKATMLNHVLDETLRLTPALYFLPRFTRQDTWVEVGPDRRFCIPKNTHVVLDVWHANHCEAFWGVARTGYPADAFRPERWANLRDAGTAARDMLHFGFGHGPRVCPGRFLGLLETGLVVGAIVKLFHFEAVNDHTTAQAAVSTKPADGALVDLWPRATT